VAEERKPPDRRWSERKRAPARKAAASPSAKKKTQAKTRSRKADHKSGRKGIAAGSGGAQARAAAPARAAAMAPMLAPAKAAAEPNASATLGFADFLSEVAEAMLTAQQQLDLQTEAYLSGGSNPRPLPTLFRLPKLEAEMKFALQKKEKKELELLFYADSSAASSLQQHSLKFELVAVPPPPESRLTPGEYVPLLPRIMLLVDRARRGATLERILQDDSVCKALGLPAGAKAEQHSEIAVWELKLPSASLIPLEIDRCVLVARPAETAPISRLCLIQIPKDPPQAPLKSQPFDVGAIDAWLGEFLRRLGERQKQLFDRAR
jgi:hypothetical protein